MSNAAKVLELAKKYRKDTAEGLARLVRIPSESMKEGDVQHEVERQMHNAGFDEVIIDGLGNVIGRIGNGKTVLAIDGINSLVTLTPNRVDNLKSVFLIFTSLIYSPSFL